MVIDYAGIALLGILIVGIWAAWYALKHSD